MKGFVHRFYDFIGYEPPIFSKAQAKQIVDLFEKYYGDRVVGLEEKLRNGSRPYKLPLIDFGPGDAKYTLEFFKDEFIITENEPLPPGAIRMRLHINGYPLNTYANVNVNISSIIQSMLGNVGQLKTIAPIDQNIIFRGEIKVSEIERSLKFIKMMEVIEK